MLAISRASVATWNERFDVPGREEIQTEPTDLEAARRWRKSIEERVIVVEERIERLEAQLTLRLMAEDDLSR